MNGRGREVSGRRRTRGVRASRLRLTQALAQAGLKTQAALAERMADIEGLDAPPRQLVNRVFRELPVEPLSLERIARALAVSAHTLYFTVADTQTIASCEPMPPAPLPASATTPAPAARARLWRVIVAGVAGVALTATLVWPFLRDTTAGCDLREWMLPAHTARDRLGIVIGRFYDDPDNLGQMYLAAALRHDPKLTRHVSVLTTCRVFAMAKHADAPPVREKVIDMGRQLLRTSGAQVLIWGRADDEQLRIRFVSALDSGVSMAQRLNRVPIATLGGDPEIQLSLEDPGQSLARVKIVALTAMSPASPALRQSRQRMIQAYNGNIASRAAASTHPVAAHAVAH